MFKNLFSSFKKKEETDFGNMTVHQLSTGAIFEYDLRTFEVLETYTYDWGDEEFSKEYKVTDGNKTLFLSVEEDDELEISLSQKTKVRHIKEDLPEFIKQHETAPTSLTFEGRTYYLEGEYPGFFNDEKNDEWLEFITWEYYDESEENIISIEQWDENEFEASYGIIVAERNISNLLPAPKK